MKFQVYTCLACAVIAAAASPSASVNAATLGPLIVSSGTTTVNAPVTHESVTLTGGTIDGTSTLTSLGAFTQTGGRTRGSVTIVSDGFTLDGGNIGEGSTVTSSGPQLLKGGSIGGALDGTGAITVSEDDNFLFNDLAVIHNAESLEVSGGLLASLFGGIVDTGGNLITISGGQLSGNALKIADDETVTVTGGRFFPRADETIANLIQSDGEVGQPSLDLNVTEAFTQTGGTIFGGTIKTGTFTQAGNGTIAAGTVVTADSVQLQGGTIAGTLSVPRAVTVSGGTTRLTGSIVGTTDLTVAGGRLDATGTGTIDTASNTVTVAGGTLVIDEGAFAPFNETLVIEGGTVTGGNLAVSSITQSGGLIAEGTTITTRSGSTLSGGVIAGTLTGDSLRSTVAFLSSGTTTLTGTMGGNISVGADATFDIKAGGFSNSEGQFYANLGTLNNAGTIATSGGLINEGVLRNSGTIDVGGLVRNRNSGTLQVDGTLTAGGVRSTGSMISGGGTIDADVDLLGATIAPGNSPGTLTIDGNLSADASSVLAFELGGLLQGDNYDWLNVSGNVSLGVNGGIKSGHWAAQKPATLGLGVTRAPRRRPVSRASQIAGG
jgi:hypothetical protein